MITAANKQCLRSDCGERGLQAHGKVEVSCTPAAQVVICAVDRVTNEDPALMRR